MEFLLNTGRILGCMVGDWGVDIKEGSWIREIVMGDWKVSRDEVSDLMKMVTMSGLIFMGVRMWLVWGKQSLNVVRRSGVILVG